MKISSTCKLHMAGACISEISRKSSSASTGGKIPPQEGRQLKIYELCRTPRKLWYLQSIFLPLPKKIKTFIDQSWSRNLMFQNFLQIHNPYPISSCGPSFQCHLKLFRRAFLSSRSSPGLTIQPKRSSTRGESLFFPFKSKNMSSETDWRATCGELEACVYSPD